MKTVFVIILVVFGLIISGCQSAEMVSDADLRVPEPPIVEESTCDFTFIGNITLSESAAIPYLSMRDGVVYFDWSFGGFFLDHLRLGTITHEGTTVYVAFAKSDTVTRSYEVKPFIIMQESIGEIYSEAPPVDDADYPLASDICNPLTQPMGYFMFKPWGA